MPAFNENLLDYVGVLLSAFEDDQVQLLTDVIRAGHDPFALIARADARANHGTVPLLAPLSYGGEHNAERAQAILAAMQAVQHTNFKIGLTPDFLNTLVLAYMGPNPGAAATITAQVITDDVPGSLGFGVTGKDTIYEYLRLGRFLNAANEQLMGTLVTMEDFPPLPETIDGLPQWLNEMGAAGLVGSLLPDPWIRGLNQTRPSVTPSGGGWIDWIQDMAGGILPVNIFGGPAACEMCARNSPYDIEATDEYGHAYGGPSRGFRKRRARRLRKFWGKIKNVARRVLRGVGRAALSAVPGAGAAKALLGGPPSQRMLQASVANTAFTAANRALTSGNPYAAASNMDSDAFPGRGR